MKLSTSITTTAAMFALIAPAAHASSGKSIPRHHAAKPAATRPRVIVVPPITITSAGVTSLLAQSDDCQTSGNNCSPQELCDVWGINCDLVEVAPAVPAATTDTRVSGS